MPLSSELLCVPMDVLSQHTKNPQQVLLFLESLRKSLIRIGLVVFSLTLIGLYFASSIFQYLKRITGAQLAAFGVPDAFLAFVSAVVGLGIFAAMPYISFAILAITVISAILTSTPDLFNLTLMAVPLYILFELGLFGMRFWKK